MNSLDQYIQLFLDNRNLIDTKAAPLINRWRDEALSQLMGKDLPHIGDEGYEHISVDRMFQPDRGLNLARVNIPADTSIAYKCDLPHISSITATVVNDSFIPNHNIDNRLPQGVIFCSLNRAAALYPELVDRYYNRIAKLTDVTTALNTLLVQDGVFIYLPDSTYLSRPLQILNILNAVTPLMAVRRLLIVVGKNARLQLLSCDHNLPGAGNILSSLVTEIFVEENATLDFCEMEETQAVAARCARTYISQKEGADVCVNGITLSSGTTRNDFDIYINGSRAQTVLSGMVIGTEHRATDNCSVVRHINPHSRSRQLFKYVLDDYSIGSFEGKIVVMPHAVGTQAYQSDRNILASANARMYTRPQLEIYNDDVKCSHGAATGQLDQSALFYMRTRGIPERQARVMLMQAFMADVIDTIRIDGLRERLRMLIEKRFSGTTVACGECKSTCNKPEDEQ